MNILQLFNKVPYPVKDGGSVAVFNLTEGFARAGHRIDLLCLNTRKHYVRIKNYKKEIPENINIYSVDITTDIKFIPLIKNLLFSKKPYIAERFISEKFKKILAEKLQKTKYDIIQIEGLYMMPYIKTIKKYSNTTISYRAHNIEHEIWQLNLKQEKNPIKRIYLKNMINRLKKFEISYINKYDTLIPITERDGNIFNKLGNKKPMHVSPAGIDTKKYELSKPDFSKIKIFHLGSLDWIPNTEGLLWFLKTCWTKINKIKPDLTFTLAGRNASPEFEKQIKSYNNTVYKGEIKNALDFMNRHNVMIVPLLSGSGMRIKIIEGMACGNVIISTSKGAEGIPAKNNKEILIADTPEDFIRHITQTLNQKEKIKQISDAAKQFISVNFDNFAISNLLLKFYSELLKKK